MEFLKKYPVKTHEIIHYPLMISDLLKKYRVPGMNHASLAFIYNFSSFFKIKEGTIRTNLSRMKKAGDITSYKEGDIIRYEAGTLQKERMNNVLSRKKKRTSGFVLAIFSFRKEQEKERTLTRSILEYIGFVRIAQNSYINSRQNIKELRKNLDLHNLTDNVFIFEINKISLPEFKKLSKIWNIEERNKFLNDFYTDLNVFIDQWDGTAEDWAHRLGAAWLIYIVYVQNTEILLPLNMLPTNYPYDKINKYMNKINTRNYKQLLSYIRKINN